MELGGLWCVVVWSERGRERGVGRDGGRGTEGEKERKRERKRDSSREVAKETKGKEATLQNSRLPDFNEVVFDLPLLSLTCAAAPPRCVLDFAVAFAFCFGLTVDLLLLFAFAFSNLLVALSSLLTLSLTP